MLTNRPNNERTMSWSSCPQPYVQGAPYLPVGEASGYREARDGVYCIGESAINLNEMLRAVGISHDQVSLSNALKCYCNGQPTG
jgi:uracil-DNA glycosylase family 4